MTLPENVISNGIKDRKEQFQIRIMKKIQWLVFFISFSLSAVLHAQTKTFEIIPQFPEPGEQFTISYNPTSTNLKDATAVSGLMCIYDNFKWIVKDFSLIKTRVGTWETREQLSSQAAVICCVFNSGSEIDNGGKEAYSGLLEQSTAAYVGWTMLHSAVFQKEIPVKLDTVSFIKDSVAFQWLKSKIEQNPQSRLDAFYQLLMLHKIVEPTTAQECIKSELRFLLMHPLDNQKQYNVQKVLALLDGTKNKVFVDSVQKALIKSYPKGVYARDLALKKIFLEANPVSKGNQYFDFVSKFLKQDFEDVNTEAEILYNDKIYKSIINHAIKKNNDFSIVLNSLKELSFANLIDFSRELISVPFNNKKTSVEILNVFASSIVSEIETRTFYVPKEYREKLSLNQWRKFALKNAAPEYFTYAKILEKLQKYKESQRFLEKIRLEYGYENASFNEVYYRMLIRNDKIAEARNYFELTIKENKVTSAMFVLAKKNFLKDSGNESEFENYLKSLQIEEKK